MAMSPISVLLHSKSLSLFKRDSLDQVVLARRPFVYPDGTLEFDCSDDHEVNSLYRELPLLAMSHQTAYFRTLLGCPLRRYYLCFRRDYETRLKASSLGLGVGMLEFFPGEWEKARLQFSVTFNRKPQAKIVASLVLYISETIRKVMTHGVANEGPVYPIRPMLRVRGNRADLELDASRSGPRTLNFLLLEALNLGHDKWLVEKALYNQDDPILVQRSLDGAKRAYSICKMKWSEAYEKEFVEAGCGGYGEPELFYDLQLQS